MYGLYCGRGLREGRATDGRWWLWRKKVGGLVRDRWGERSPFMPGGLASLNKHTTNKDTCLKGKGRVG